jgi:hypothetical protein
MSDSRDGVSGCANTMSDGGDGDGVSYCADTISDGRDGVSDGGNTISFQQSKVLATAAAGDRTELQRQSCKFIKRR